MRAERPYERVYVAYPHGAGKRLAVYEATERLRCGRAECGALIDPGTRFTRTISHLDDAGDDESWVEGDLLPAGWDWRAVQAGLVFVPACAACVPVPPDPASVVGGGRP